MRICILFLCAIIVPAASAFPQSAAQVAQKTSLFGTAKDITLTVVMELKTKSGTKERGLSISIKRSPAGMRVLAAMTSPAFLSQMKFLTRRETDGLTTTWLKTSQGVRKLTASSGSERIFDSQFTVEDFSDIDLKGFTASLSEATLDSVACFAVALRPTTAAGYSRKVVYVQKDDFELRGMDFYDDYDVLIRQYRVIESRLIGGIPFPVQSVMKDLATDDETSLTIESADTTRVIPESTFNKAGL